MYEIQERQHETDLSELISFSMSFQPLQLLFQDILKRVKQSESDNERQDDEINDLKKAIEELRQRDSERESQLKDLQNQLQQQEQKLQHQEQEQEQQEGGGGPQETTWEERRVSEAKTAREGASPVDLTALQEEVEKIKKLMGEFQRTGRRRTIEELYAARKRKESALSSSSLEMRRHGPTSSTPTQQMEEITEEGERRIGDEILYRAQEELGLYDDKTQEEQQQEEEELRRQQQEQILTSTKEQEGVAGEAVQPPRRLEETQQQERQEQQQGALHAEQQEERQQQQQVISSQQQQRPISQEQERMSGDESPLSGAYRSGEDQTPPFRPDSPEQRRVPERVTSGSPAFAASSVSSITQSKSQPQFGGSVADSIFDRLRQDGADIEHLNRIVAEILSEMKVLHADVDLMRTVNTVPEISSESTEATKRPSRPSLHTGEDVANLTRRVGSLEEALNRLQKRLDSPRESSTTAADLAAATAAAAENQERRVSMQNELRQLKDRLNALDQAQDRMNDKISGVLDAAATSEGDTGVSPAQFAIMGATVDALEKQLAAMQQLGLRNCDEELEALKEAVEKLQNETDALRKACAQLEDKKADKSDEQRRRSSISGSKVIESSPTRGTGAEVSKEDYAAAIADLLRRLEDMQQRLSNAEANVKDLEEVKADRTALQRINDDLKHLRHLLELGAGKKGDSEATGLAAAMQEELLRKMQQQIDDHVQNFNNTREGTSNELDALREYVEQLDHRKADAQLVANKAERDYVENALERLMREVEQVLNATNAGLIDTLDKSLNVLRDMLDGKATKNDMAQLQRIVSEEQAGGGAPEALAGFKGFRCLGCNRPVETMRPRVMGSRLQPFVNRLPQNHPADPIAARIQQGPAGASEGHSTPT